MASLDPLSRFRQHLTASGHVSPWDDESSRSMPRGHQEMLRWCEYIYLRNTTFRAGQERIISYFLTHPEVNNPPGEDKVGDDARNQWISLLNDTLDVRTAAKQMGASLACYGNAFLSVVVPFTRYLISEDGKMVPFSRLADDPAVGLTWLKEKVDRFRGKDFTRDPETGELKGEWKTWKIHDVPGDFERDLQLKHWSPYEIYIREEEYGGKCRYFWKIPQDYRRALMSNDLFKLEHAPKNILKAVASGDDFRFNDDVVFHLKNATLPGVRTGGWGLSDTILVYRDLWHMQTLLRANESLARDYLIPFRVATPEVRSGADQAGRQQGLDSLHTVDQVDLSRAFGKIIREHRRDPLAWHFLPFPVTAQIFGGEASSLVPIEMLAAAEDRILSGIHLPPELFRGTLQIQAVPAALRLFEASHQVIVRGNNDFLEWVVRRVANIANYDPVVVRFSRVTQIDDLNKDMAILQLHMSQLVSGQTAFRKFNLDYDQEQRLIAEEAKRQYEMQSDMQEEMDQAAMGEMFAKGQLPPQAAGMGPEAAAGGGMGGAGAMAPAAAGGASGAPMMGGAGLDTSNMSLDELMAQADATAAELLELPETQRLSELRALGQKNEALHAMVKQKIEQKRRGAQSAGGAMLLGQTPPAAQ